MEPVLAVRGLERRFAELRAVDGISLEVRAGESFGLIGPDGAGKTTAMRLMAGLIRAHAGDIRVAGHRIPQDRNAVRRLMGYMPQQYSLYGDLSVEENLRFFAAMFGVTGAERTAREKRLLEIARLERFRERPARALSGGMYKKLALACALIHQPKVLLLDEPTNGVDPISRRELWAFLYELIGEGLAVVVSTPYMDEAERCTRVGLLVAGQLVAVGDPTQLKAGFDRTVFELETVPLLSDRLALLDEEGIEDVYLVARKTHVLSARPIEFAPTLAKIFAAHGMRVDEISVVRPTFEDVFLRYATPASTREATDG